MVSAFLVRGVKRWQGGSLWQWHRLTFQHWLSSRIKGKYSGGVPSAPSSSPWDTGGRQGREHVQGILGLLVGRWHDEAEAWTRLRVFSDTGGRKKRGQKIFRERKQYARPPPTPPSQPPCFPPEHSTQDREGQSRPSVWSARFVTQPPRCRLWNLKYVPGQAGPGTGFFCKVATKMQWKSYAKRKRYNPNVPRQKSFNFKGCLSFGSSYYFDSLWP